MGCWPEDDLGRLSAGLWPQGVGDGWTRLSLAVSVGSEIDGATIEVLSPNTALLRLEVGGFPVC